MHHGCHITLLSQKATEVATDCYNKENLCIFVSQLHAAVPCYDLSSMPPCRALLRCLLEPGNRLLSHCGKLQEKETSQDLEEVGVLIQATTSS